MFKFLNLNPTLQGVDPTQSAVADLGGSIITGIEGNPLAVLARQLGIPMHNINMDDEKVRRCFGRGGHGNGSRAMDVQWQSSTDLMVPHLSSGRSYHTCLHA